MGVRPNGAGITKWEWIVSLWGYGGVRPMLVGGKKGRKEGDRESGEHTCKKIHRITHPKLPATRIPYRRQGYLVKAALSQGDIYQVSAPG